jgi:hypothetical protein
MRTKSCISRISSVIVWYLQAAPVKGFYREGEVMDYREGTFSTSLSLIDSSDNHHDGGYQAQELAENPNELSLLPERYGAISLFLIEYDRRQQKGLTTGLITHFQYRFMGRHLAIDPVYWLQLQSAPWSGNHFSLQSYPLLHSFLLCL